MRTSSSMFKAWTRRSCSNVVELAEEDAVEGFVCLGWFVKADSLADIFHRSMASVSW